MVEEKKKYIIREPLRIEKEMADIKVTIGGNLLERG